MGYNGSLLWARQLGSAGDELLGGFAINRTDHSIYVAGSTSGNMLRTSHAIQEIKSGKGARSLKEREADGHGCFLVFLSVLLSRDLPARGWHWKEK